MGFTHLNINTYYSLLEGFSKIKELLIRAKHLNMDAIAITDQNNIFGAIEFYKEAISHGIKPIIGSTLNVEGKKIIFLVKNKAGYINLNELLSKYYKNNKLKDSDILNHNEGLICFSSYVDGAVSHNLINSNYKSAFEHALFYKNIFGDDYYLELQNHKLLVESNLNVLINKLSKELDIKCIATNFVNYVVKEDSFTHKIINSIRTADSIYDKENFFLQNDQYYLKSEYEMTELFKDYPDSIKNTEEIKNKIEFKFDFKTLHLPTYKHNEYNSKELIKKLVYEGLKKKEVYLKEYIDRCNYELKVIDDMGYNDYFLIVYDFCKYAKENGIFVGPGRGSGGGSLVGFSLNITSVDPIKYNLIFERFLNPQRISMPDFDIDFEDERRHEIIEYVQKKYGYDNVAQIITFGTFGARAAIRDVARVMKIDYSKADRIAKMIPFKLDITLDKALENESLKRLIYSNDEYLKLYENAKKIEGAPRHASTHAAGVVISEKELTNYLPLYIHENTILTQYVKDDVEKIGLVKMDFLGLRNLTIIKYALKYIKENKDIEVDIDEISYNDEATFKLLQSGYTLGVFQLESRGIRDFFVRLKPECIEDIIAGISLYRPGPMDSIGTYLKNKNNPKLIKYITPLLENILSETYGCIVYQEQVMEIFRVIGGFSYSEADLVRRAMSKKEMDTLKNERKKFIEGSLKNKISSKDANIIFDDMLDFAKYAFNKSHAASYAILGYETAFLKTKYPLEYMCALLNSAINNTKKLAQYIQETRRMKIEIVKVNVNDSSVGFKVKDNKIYFALAAIKGIGESLAKSIVKTRKKEPFESLYDFLNRLENMPSKKSVEALIKVGALDISKDSKREMLLKYMGYIDELSSQRATITKGQLSLFDDYKLLPKEREFNYSEYDLERLMEFEKEYLGFYFSSHPLNKYKNISFLFNLYSISDINELDESFNKTKVRFIAFKSRVKIKSTRRGDKMAFMTVEDQLDEIDLILFSNVYSRYESFIKENNMFLVEGRVDKYENSNPKIIVSTLEKADKIKAKEIFIKQDSWKIDPLLIKLLKRHKGEIEVKIYNSKAKKVSVLKEVKVELTKELVNDLQNIVSKQDVVIR